MKNSVLLASLLSLGLSFSASTASAGSFEVFQDAGGEYRFNLVADNFEVVLVSEGYKGKSGVANGVLSVLEYGNYDDTFEVKSVVDSSKKGGFYFNLVADNGEIIGTSEIYVSKGNAKKGIAAVQNAVYEINNASLSKKGTGFRRFVGQDDQFYFHLTASNGEIILASEGYLSEASALGGIFSILDSGLYEENFSIFQGKDDQFYFNLVSWNNEIIGRSEGYKTKKEAQKTVSQIVQLINDGLTAL